MDKPDKKETVIRCQTGQLADELFHMLLLEAVQRARQILSNNRSNVRPCKRKVVIVIELHNELCNLISFEDK